LFVGSLGFATTAYTRVIDVRTEVSAPDSVTVGERFRVKHVYSYPETLTMAVPEKVEPGSCRIVSMVWSEDKKNGTIEKALTLESFTLDLEQARLPALAVQFFTPAGDTMIAFAEETVIPVRQLAVSGADVRPLKQQWVAPRRYWPWIVAAAVLVAVAALLWWWLRRRARRAVEAPSTPVLPADHVALTELARIERMDLVSKGEFKKYYTLVTDVLRRYLSARFEVEAMDRTTEELLGELEDRGRRVDRLDGLLREADLVKFAKYAPGEVAGTAAMASAREIVVKTTPRHQLEDTGVVEAGGGAG
jgi:hypothetical protein